ncbi:MAG: thioredoxin family protein [Pirellulales bacterium]
MNRLFQQAASRLPLLAYLVLMELILTGVTCPARAQQFQFPSGGPLGGGGFGGGGSEVTLESEFSVAHDGLPSRLFVTATIAEGWHIYALDQGQLPNGGGGPMVTQINVQESASFRVLAPFQPVEPPQTHVDKEIWTGLELREHYGQVIWYAPIEFAAGVDSASLTIQGELNTQACKESCIPLKLSFAAALGQGIPVPDSFQNDTGSQPSDAGPVKSGRPSLDSVAMGSDVATGSDMSLWHVVGYGILGGLILNLMPCVLPVIGLKILSFTKQGGQSRAQILGLNLSYVAGMMLVFLVLATLAALVKLGLGDESFGWGELNTLTWFKVGMSSLVFAMALSFLGVWEIPIPGFASSNKATSLSSREGPMGAFAMGIFTTILATPCSGPFLGPVFGYTLSQSPAVIYLVFGSVGLGMGLPYLLIGMMPSLVSWLPQPGAWMETFKQLLGFVLLATVVWLLSSIHSDYFIATLSLLFGIWFACWWIGRTPITAPTSVRQTAWIGSIGIAIFIGVGAFNFLTPGKSVLPWQPYTGTALATARAEGKTVLVDFTAQWCLTCKTNLKLSINREEVRQRVEKNGVITLLADWTDRNDTIKAALNELGSASIPLLAIYPADPSREVILLPDLLTQQKVLNALDEAGPSLTGPSFKGVGAPQGQTATSANDQGVITTSWAEPEGVGADGVKAQ